MTKPLINDNPCIRLVLKSYLKQLRDEEANKSLDVRRVVPTPREFAEMTGSDLSHFYKFMRDEIGCINRDYLASVIQLLRARGFETEIGDVLVYGE